MPLNSDGIWIAGKPSYHGWTEGPYKGRPTFWGDYRYVDKHVMNGRWRGQYYKHEDADPMYYDAALPDGTSKYGQLQNDNRYGPAPASNYVTLRKDKNMTLPEWQDVLYKGSWQYQDIASKWKLSKEHPGLKYNVGATSTYPMMGEKWQFGTPYAAQIAGSLRNIIPGPRFHDSPLGENIHEKPLAVVRFAAIAAVPAAVFRTYVYDKHHHGLTAKAVRLLGKNWWITFSAVAPAGVVWSSVLALSCQVRGVDDGWNGLYASAAAGGFVRAIQGPRWPIRRVFTPLLVGSTIYCMMKTYEWGFGFPDAYRTYYNYAAPHKLQQALFKDEEPLKPQLF